MVRYAIALAVLLTLSPAALRADVASSDSPIRVFLEPFGSDSTGELDFLDAVTLDERMGDGQVVLFDDLEKWPQNEVVASLVADSVEMAMLGDTNRGAPFIFHPADFYHWEGQVFGGTLVMGPVARLVPLPSSEPLGAVGFWIFDDGNLRDSVYQVDVLDACGHSATAIVENDVGRVAGYEVEGFVGVVSDCGIVQVTVTALNMDTREAWDDPFEIDTLTVVRLVDPQSCVPAPSDDPPADDDGACHCSCRHCRHCEGNHGGHGRGHGHGHNHHSECGHNSGHGHGHNSSGGHGHNDRRGGRGNDDRGGHGRR